METNKQVLMSYNSFKADVWKNLSKYNSWGPGSFGGKDHSHIANIEGKRKEDVVLEIIKSDGLDQTDMFCKPHKYAHHLNSSQVVCYEFFRPLIDEKDKMAKAMEIMWVPSDLFISFEAEFEKEFDDGEGTNFDFFLSSNNKRNNLYVEVKYTEQGFGLCKDNKTHEQKFERTYKTLIETSPCIKEEKKENITFSQMREYYQLFRNTLRIQNDSDYVVLLYPERNTITKAQFERFRDVYLSPNGCKKVKGVFWESLLCVMSQRFKEKFFFYI